MTPADNPTEATGLASQPAAASATGPGGTADAPVETRYFGIRHHGPGCARSLQRALTERGLSCRHIVTEARARVAAQWLLESPHGLAEIGFACGFADQPHFTREFARHVDLTPARYRQAFAVGGMRGSDLLSI